MKVIWRTKWDSVDNGCGQWGGSTGQLTKIESEGVIAYVRENVIPSGGRGFGTFVISSGARLGDKREGRRGEPVLELAAPARAWDRIAKEIEDLDAAEARPHGRPLPARRVVAHRRFTADWAEFQFRRLHAVRQGVAP